MEKINWKDLPDASTPINAENLNTMESNIENAININLANDVEVETNIKVGENKVYAKYIEITMPTPEEDWKNVSTFNATKIIMASGNFIVGTQIFPLFTSFNNQETTYFHDGSKLYIKSNYSFPNNKPANIIILYMK